MLGIVLVVVLVVGVMVAARHRKRVVARKDGAAAIVMGSRDWTGPSRLRGKPSVRGPRAAARGGSR